MDKTVQKIRIYSNVHKRYKALCSKQKLQLKEATEIILKYVLKNEIDIKGLEDEGNVPLPQLVKEVNDNVTKSSNTYVSFQRTFENQNLFMQYSMLLLMYNSMQFANKDKEIEYKKRLFFDLVLMKIHIHPKQELIKTLGGASIFGEKYIQNAGASAYDNKGSVKKMSNYLDKEERQYQKQSAKQMANYLDAQERAAIADSSALNTPDKLAAFNEKYKGALKEDYKEFFSDNSLLVDKKEAINYLDNASSNVSDGKERFFSFALNFSKEESYIIEAKKDRREFLKKLTDKAVDQYARNFNYKGKSFSGKDVG